ncbi:MAG: hypothetical protein ACYC2I_03680 [Elusimicrobiales bacterium]
MDLHPSIALESLAALSVAKCLQRISRVSAGTWQVEGAKVSYGSVRDALAAHDFSDPAAAVYISLDGPRPVTSAMILDPANIEYVSKCFTGHSFPRGGPITPAEEVMLTELANIILNAVTNALLNAVKKSFIPALPRFAQGGLDVIEKEFLAIPALKQNFRIVTVTINMCAGASSAKAEVFSLVPEELAMELDNLRPPAGSHDGIA